MMDVLEVDHLTKTFGATKAVDDVGLRVTEGSIYGFVGENGAGKTTTMRLILGLIKPDAGEVRVCGHPVRFGMTRTNRFVGYLPDVPEFYPYMRATEYMRFCGEVAGLGASEISRRSGELLEMVGLGQERKKIGAYSRGMKQRLGLAQALITRPSLLICDEPTSALDPVGRKEVLEILNLIRAQTTVLFSTHILSDVERVCDRAAVIHKGRIVMDGSLDDLVARHGSRGLRIEFASMDDATRFRSLVPPWLITGQDGEEVIMAGAMESDKLQVIERLATYGILPVRFESITPSVETLLLEAVS